MNNFKRVSALVLAGMTLMFASGSSHGLGFGRPTSRAILGETLWVTVPVRLEAGEEIANECLAADVYFGDDKVSGSAVNVVLQPGSADERIVKVSTTAMINEPVVTVYLAAGCTAKITRKFVAFADPPGMSLPNVADGAPVEISNVIQSATTPASGDVSSPSALSAAMQPRRRALAPVQAASQLPAAQPRMAHKPDQVLSGAPSMALTAPAQGRSAKAAGKPGPAPKPHPASAPLQVVPGEGGRLVLDPVEAEATVVPNLQMAGSLTTAANADEAPSPELLARRQAAAAVWLALNASPDQLARDKQRLLELEQRLAQLKQEGDLTKQSVEVLRARANQSGGWSKWLILLGLVALGAVALAAYLYKQLRKQKELGESWWASKAEEPQQEHESPGSRRDASNTTIDFVHLPTEPSAKPDRAGATVASRSEPKRSPESKVHPSVPDTPVASAPVKAPGPTLVDRHAEPLREVSVEELIDLEQQAEFFVVLGQDDAAIDLLEGHVQGTAASPLPFLKLLEIYRRVGKKGDYERVQAEFNKRFNAYAPSWESDLQCGHTLADYPGVIERLQELWHNPFKAMEVLEKSLTRPESGEDTFELPAYRELLFLYAVARDLSERDVQDRTTVDLLLPVVDTATHEPVGSIHDDVKVEPLMATRPIKAQPGAVPSINMDLHLEDLRAPAPNHKP